MVISKINRKERGGRKLVGKSKTILDDLISERSRILELLNETERLDEYQLRIQSLHELNYLIKSTKQAMKLAARQGR